MNSARGLGRRTGFKTKRVLLDALGGPLAPAVAPTKYSESAGQSHTKLRGCGEKRERNEDSEKA